MMWAAINIVSGLIVCVIIAYKMGAYPEKFTFPEMAGMGFICAGMILRVGGPILARQSNSASPYDDWSVAVLHFGLAVYFAARMLRHKWNTWLQVRESRRYLVERGKL